MAKIKSCGFLIYRNHPVKSFLLMRHPDRWDLPKGHMDPGETKLECAFRELEEETAIRSSDVRLEEGFKFKHKYLVPAKKRYETDEDFVDKKLIVFLAEMIRDVQIEVTEHAGYEWFEWNPPHAIQLQTIDPLLQHLADYWDEPQAE